MGSQVFFQCSEEQFREMLKETLLEVVDELQLGRENHTTLLNIQEAAALLNLAVATIYEKTSQRTIPHYKHGKKVLFKKSELLAWVELRKVRSTDEIQMALSKRGK
jgi:excisionase family DNA binding protein